MMFEVDAIEGRLLLVGAVLALSLVFTYGLKKLVWRRLEKMGQGSSEHWSARVRSRINGPANFLILVAILAMGRQVAPAVVRNHVGLTMGLKIAVILSAIWMIDRLVALVAKSANVPAGVGASSRVLAVTLARLSFLALGSLIVLDTLGISVTPILASLGVGSVAVALALQDTLSNFFSGIYLLVDKPISIGDFVRLEDGLEGRVHHIGWRSTELEYQGNSRVVIPNSKLSGARITNWSMPEPKVALVVPIGVGYESNLEHVEKITLEVARDVCARFPEAGTDAPPSVRFTQFGDSAIQLNLSLVARSFLGQAELRHELIKSLHKRYAMEKIELPFPQRVVRLQKEI